MFFPGGKRRLDKKAATRDEREAVRKARHAASLRNAQANIGPPQPIKKAFAKLREACRTNLPLFQTEVFPNTTGLKPFGQVQLDSIEISYKTIQNGGLVQKLEPRRYGKTTRTINEAIWAILYNFKPFTAICGANRKFSTGIFNAIKLELSSNPILFEMFPEVCHPIWSLDGKGQAKANSQHIDGRPTNLLWGKDEITLANVEGAEQSGATIMVSPIGSVRGMFKRVNTADGIKSIRPGLYLLDDVQTNKTARSHTMTENILSDINTGILFGGGLQDSPTVINLATMIQPDDVTDQIAKDTSWVTVRYKMLMKPSANEDFWFGPYAKARREYLVIPSQPLKTLANKEAAAAKATALYRKHRKKADAGAEVSWDWAYPWNDKKQLCISATQAAYDTRIDRGEEVFATECQNDPIRLTVHEGETSKPTREQLLESIVTIPRGVVPIDLNRLIIYIDVHKRLFYWVAVAKNLETKTKHIVDYNTWPEQTARKFTLENAKRTIPQLYPGTGIKAMAEMAVAKFLTIVGGMRFKNQNGAPVGIEEIRIDANWGGTTKNVRKAIRNHPLRDKIWGCHGIGRTAAQTGLDDWKRKPGEEKGPAFVKIPHTPEGVQQLNIDTNIWKTETNLALTSPNTEQGTLTVFDGDDILHQLFFEHLLSEICQPKTGRRDIEEFDCPKGGQNHWYDCLVGACVDDDKSQPTGPTGNEYSF